MTNMPDTNMEKGKTVNVYEMLGNILIHKGDGLLKQALGTSRIPQGKYMLSLQRKEERNQNRAMKEKDNDLVIVVDRATSRPMTWVDHQFYFVHSVRPNSKRSPGYGYELEQYTRKEARKLVEKHTEYRQNNNLSETRLDLMLLKPGRTKKQQEYYLKHLRA